METTIVGLDGQNKGTLALPAIFETPLSSQLLHEVITGYNANQRAGTHATKSRGQVSGGGRKPWKQKGTGNARVGSNRSPLFRKGGIIFGPKPHGYTQDIPQAKRRKSLGMALAAKFADGRVVVIDDLGVTDPKTRQMAALLKNLKLEGKQVLMVVDHASEVLRLAGRNIPDLMIAEARNINAYQVLWAETVLFTRPAVESVGAR